MPDTPVEPKADEPYHPELRARVSRLEDDVHDMKAMMRNVEQIVLRIEATLNATLPHLATKAELADLRAETKADIAAARLATEREFAGLRADLADKPSKTYMWGVLTALLAAYACGLAALAIVK
jgi:hypothetical protein